MNSSPATIETVESLVVIVFTTLTPLVTAWVWWRGRELARQDVSRAAALAAHAVTQSVATAKSPAKIKLLLGRYAVPISLIGFLAVLYTREWPLSMQGFFLLSFQLALVIYNMCMLQTNKLWYALLGISKSMLEQTDIHRMHAKNNELLSEIVGIIMREPGLSPSTKEQLNDVVRQSAQKREAGTKATPTAGIP